MVIRSIANEEINRLLVGIPRGHRHVRAVLQLEDETLILQEATLANLCRAYIRISTDPRPGGQALELSADCSEDRKPGYARCQHLETARRAEEVANELAELLRGAA